MNKLKALPKATFLLASAEFAERFAYYGLAALLPIYMPLRGLSQDASTAIFAAFRGVAYLSPILGSILADAWLAKYWTIVCGTVLYAIGMTGLAMVGWFEGSLPLFFLGLLIVALATGGIKSVVSALLGDQIDESSGPKGLLDFSFSIYYSAINFGAILSYILIPTLRTQISEPLNFNVAFSVLAATLWVVLFIFALPKIWYRILPAQGSKILQIGKILILCIRRKVMLCRNRRPVDPSGFLQLASPDYESDEIESCGSVLRISFVFATLPIFWLLLDQQATRWVYQMMQMDRRVPFTSLEFPPEVNLEIFRNHQFVFNGVNFILGHWSIQCNSSVYSNSID